MLDLDTYKPAEKSSTCKQCGSTNVYWHQLSETPTKNSRWILCEIFMIEDEEVYSPTDLHTRYCERPLYAYRVKNDEPLEPKERKVLRQAEINIAAAKYFDDDDAPVESVDEIKTDDCPYSCATCGMAVIDGLSDHPNKKGLTYDYNGGIPDHKHTCTSGGIDDMAAARAQGTRKAMRVKFIDISKRMDYVKRLMDDWKDADAPVSEDSAEVGSEYLMLRKRLYTEIPK